MRLEPGMTAVVTGAASGIGRALADRFARAGLRVVLADIEETALDAAVTELRDAGHQALGIRTDVTSRASVDRLAEQTTARYGDVHVLCNNAGVLSASTEPIWALAAADWDWVQTVNVRGVLHGIQAFVPRMLAQDGQAHVVNTASVFGLLPARAAYDVSKHTVVALSEVLRTDLEANTDRVSVSVLCPGLVRTGLANAERNRGDGYGEPRDPGLFVSLLIERGGPATEVADATFDAVEQNRFWVLTHPEWDEAIRERTDQVLSREPAPAPVRRRRRPR